MKTLASEVRYFFRSIATVSYWRYALFSAEAMVRVLAFLGALWLFMELLDFLSIYTRDKYSQYALIPLLILAILAAVATRRPVSRIAYKLPNKDYCIEVRIGDLFEGDGDVVVSTNTTFDTEMAGGLIDTGSVQGQVANLFFGSNTAEIDRQLDSELVSIPFEERAGAPGKTREYPVGTVARVRAHGRTFYFVAMSRLNDQGTAGATVRNIEDALSSLWQFVTDFGELRNVSIPVMGTGRGRIAFPRKKMVERIAQSFADASKDRIFSHRLTVVVRPKDAENFGVNLHEIRDYLVHSLHP